MRILDIVILLGGLALITGVVKLAIAAKKKLPKKQGLALIAGSCLLMGASIQLQGPSHFIELSQDTYTTNDRGVALIKGTTNEDAQVTIAGNEVPHQGQFDFEVALEQTDTKKLTIVSRRNGSDIKKTITVKPAKAYLAYLQEEAEKERLLLAETALVTAEQEPTQENYDVAFTNIKAVASASGLQDRLAIVKKHLPIYSALKKAETSKNRQDYDEAVNAVKLASLNQSHLTQRLKDLDEQINIHEEKIRIETLVTAAKALVEKAESSKTEADYQAAIASLQVLPEKNQQLDQRLASVHQHIENEKQAAAQAAQAAEAQQQATLQPVMGQPAASETVLVTPTGSKYHRRKCGSGTYTPTSLEAAQNRGLTPCAKCF